MTENSEFDVTLTPPTDPLFCQETRFCFPYPVSIRIREKAFGQTGGRFECIGSDGKAWFRVIRKPGLDRKGEKTLSDVFGTELFHVALSSSQKGVQLKVRSGAKDEDLMDLDVEAAGGFIMAAVWVKNIPSGQTFQITYRGNTRKAGTFYFGDFQQKGTAIARRVSAGTYDEKAYDLTVANNVDLSMCAAISLGIDEIIRNIKT